jgi:hypothetical protein
MHGRRRALSLVGGEIPCCFATGRRSLRPLAMWLRHKENRAQLLPWASQGCPHISVAPPGSRRRGGRRRGCNGDKERKSQGWMPLADDASWAVRLVRSGNGRGEFHFPGPRCCDELRLSCQAGWPVRRCRIRSHDHAIEKCSGCPREETSCWEVSNNEAQVG